jgi:hypothetical protein
MKVVLLFLVLAGAVAGTIKLYWRETNLSPRGEGQLVENDLERYDFDNLRKRGGVASEINILGAITEVEARRKEEKEFATKKFVFESQGKRISGMVNYRPERSSLSPVVVMVRGYADKEGYFVGSGSWRVADELAAAGMATFSIDFLGFGDSDGESQNMMEARFEKVPAVRLDSFGEKLALGG